MNPFLQRLPNYYRIIRKPIDLATIKRKFFIGAYLNHGQFNSDMKRMFNNSLIFNKDKTSIFAKTKELYQFYEIKYQEILKKIEGGRLSEENPKANVGKETIADRL